MTGASPNNTTYTTAAVIATQVSTHKREPDTLDARMS